MGNEDKNSCEFVGVSLEWLLVECQHTLHTYQQTKDRNIDTKSCEEILRRAAIGDATAFSMLIEHISLPRIESWCRTNSKFRSRFASAEDIQDIQQETAIRLVRKFRHASSPYQPGAFKQYLHYLKMTMFSVVIDHQDSTTIPNKSGARSMVSLEMLRDLHGIEAAISTNLNEQFEQRERFQQLLTLIPDQVSQHIFMRRFGYYESPEEIAKAMDLDIKEVYRYVERTIRKLARLPETRELFEE